MKIVIGVVLAVLLIWAALRARRSVGTGSSRSPADGDISALSLAVADSGHPHAGVHGHDAGAGHVGGVDGGGAH